MVLGKQRLGIVVVIDAEKRRQIDGYPGLGFCVDELQLLRRPRNGTVRVSAARCAWQAGLSHSMTSKQSRCTLFPFTHSSAKLSPPPNPMRFCSPVYLEIVVCVGFFKCKIVPSGHPSQSISNASFTGGRGAVAAGTGGRAGHSS